MIKKGVYAAGLSVLNTDRTLNIDATINHASEAIQSGLHGVFFFGSTGQSQLISIKEKKELITKISSHKLRKQFFLGTGNNSLNENIDIGQIEGGFIQGLGWLTCEELCFSKEGKLLTTGPSTYKLPGSRDIPQTFNVKLLEKADNEEKTIFRSKAVGEPPLLLAISHFLALKEAIRASSTNSRPELLNSPATPSEILKVLKV